MTDPKARMPHFTVNPDAEATAMLMTKPPDMELSRPPVGEKPSANGSHQPIRTAKWPLFSITGRIAVDEGVRAVAPQVIEQDSTHKAAQFEMRSQELRCAVRAKEARLVFCKGRI